MHQVVVILVFLSYSIINCIQDESHLYGSRLRYKNDLNFRRRMSEKQHAYSNVTFTSTVSTIANTVNTEKAMITSKPLVKVNKFEELDLSESRSSQYIKDTSHSILKDYANEKMCFTWLLGAYAQDLPVTHYKVSRNIIDYIVKNSDSIKITCSNPKTFSFCQEAYAVVVNYKTSSIYSFRRTDYLPNSMLDVSVIMPLSLNRFDRLHYLLQRWKGDVVIGVFITTGEIEKAVRMISKYSSCRRIVFVLYIKEIKLSIKPHYVGMKNQRYFNSIFPINFLRDLCIESISTTHYLYLDGDVFMSTNTYSNIMENKQYLANPSNVFLLILFQTNSSKVSSKCLKRNDCQSEWNRIPDKRYQLERAISEEYIVPFDTPMHNTLKVKKWFKKDTIYPIKLCKLCEPYAVIRRSAENPIFHRYYINYGYNKVSLISRLIYDNYSFYVIPRSFGVDIPHKPTNMSESFKKNKRQHEMFELRELAMKSTSKRVSICDIECPE